MKLIVAYITITIGLLPAVSQATVLSGPTVNESNGHTYYLLAQDSWTSSQAEAVALGGNLATINDESENAWVFSTFGGASPNGRNIWIGLNDAAVEGVYAWADGSPVGYANWALGEPNDATQGPAEDFVHIWQPNSGQPVFQFPGTWNDGPNSMAQLVSPFAISQPFGVVEIVPEPGACVLFSSAVLGLLARRQIER